MTGTKKPTRSKPKSTKPMKVVGSRKLPYHAFWSGSISFGLVNVPVLVYPASRHSGVRLRLMSPEGALLRRRFFCPHDGKEVAADEIVRGYELDDGSYMIIDDDELEAIEPRKTREIDLREFVDLGDLPPMLLERGYYLTPLKEATKAYRLLAEVMEKTQRAGIATFVMREREYLIAIFARDGILCAETLRFHDEIRDPRDVGLPVPAPAPRQRIAAFERSIDALFSKTLVRNDLADTATAALKAIIEKKKRAGRDLIRTDHQTEDVGFDDDDDDDNDDVDLLETIRQSLRYASAQSGTRAKPAERSSHGVRPSKKGKSPVGSEKKKPTTSNRGGEPPPSGKARSPKPGSR